MIKVLILLFILSGCNSSAEETTPKLPNYSFDKNAETGFYYLYSDPRPVGFVYKGQQIIELPLIVIKLIMGIVIVLYFCWIVWHFFCRKGEQ